ncbi:MAG: hypothetical protein ACREIM_04805 [Nitrospiraceae bacterium]
MFTGAGVPAFANPFMNWNLIFARQPEPDLEFTEEDLEDAAPQPSPSMKSPKPSNKRPVLWMVLLLVLGGIAYVAMDPDVVMRALEPYLGEGEVKSMPPMPPPQAKPVPSIPAPSTATGEQLAAPPVTPVSPVPPVQSTAAVPSIERSGPLFAEGQRVMAVPDPSRPGAPIALFLDSAGTQPGPTVPANATLTVMDGELQNAAWIYAVRTDDGLNGWVAEKHLKFKR